MAQKPDGKPARTDRVTFTKPAAERIAKVVRTVEGGDRDAGPLTFGSRFGGVNQKVFRVATFTGAWSIGSSKTVTFRGVTNTVSVTNLFVPITKTAATGSCAIAKEGTAWYLISGLPGVARGTFTAPWAKGATAAVTDAVDAGTTYTAKNYFAGITASGSRACSIAYAGGEWILIAAEC
jgi:hypothetical protein